MELKNIFEFGLENMEIELRTTNSLFLGGMWPDCWKFRTDGRKPDFRRGFEWMPPHKPWLALESATVVEFAGEDVSTEKKAVNNGCGLEGFEVVDSIETTTSRWNLELRGPGKF